jgi:hypothetical protein
MVGVVFGEAFKKGDLSSAFGGQINFFMGTLAAMDADLLFKNFSP